MAKYSKKAQSKVEKVMHKRKHGTLKSGSGKKVTSRKQAIAIGLSGARKAGAKVPNKRTSKKNHQPLKIIIMETKTSINSLILINNDRYEGYKKAAEQAKDGDLKTLFTKNSQLRKRFGESLRQFADTED